MWPAVPILLTVWLYETSLLTPDTHYSGEVKSLYLFLSFLIVWWELQGIVMIKLLVHIKPLEQCLKQCS